MPTTTPTLPWVAAIALASLLAAGRTPMPGAPPPSSDEQKNILLITLDTARADLLAPWGGEGVAPNLDALAAESLVAGRAWAPAPLTLPSHASMFTGLYPFAHGVRDNDLFQLAATAPTVAAALQAAGWRTEAIVASTVMRAGAGLAQGFEHYVDLAYRHSRNTLINIRRPAAEVSTLALDRLAQRDARPWFLWLHYFDLHQPYVAPNSPARTAPMREQYEAQMRYVDQELARVIATLRSSGELARTWIVVCGDHGEGVMTQQEVTHGFLAEDGTLRIPLFVRRPDGALRGRIEAPASAVDIAPTLLAIAGLHVDGSLHGRDLLAAHAQELAGGEAAAALADRTIWFETWAGWHVYGWHRLEGVIAGRFKYVRNVGDELFDIADPADPRLERDNLAAERPEVVHALQQRMAALQEEPVARFDSTATSLPPEEVARLRELGYVARSIGRDEASDDGTLDPRQHYQVAIDVEWALGEAAAGRCDAAATRLATIVAEHPDHALFREVLGKVLFQAGRLDEAAVEFRAALAREEALVAANFYLGAIEAKAGHAAAALRLLTRTVELSPVHLEAWLQLRALHGNARDYPAVLRDTATIVRLAAATGGAEGDSIAAQSLDSWLPNVLRKLAADPALAAHVDAALATLGDAPGTAIERARALLTAARPRD